MPGSDPLIVVPEGLASNTVDRAGQVGAEWIAGLPALVAKLCEAWDLTVWGTPMHGYLSLVLPVMRGKQRCALKICGLNEAADSEAIALRSWQGNGAVLLLDYDPAARALLLEWLDHDRNLEQIAIDDAVPICGRLLRRLAAPDPMGLRSLHDLGQATAQSLPVRWQKQGRPLPHNLLRTAAELADRLSPHSGGRLVNYDLHYQDVLAGEREPWLAVDPKPVIGDVEYGVAQLLWCGLDAMQASRGLAYYFDCLVDTAELDRQLARDWSLVRVVDYWLWALSIGLTEDPARCEIVANWLLAR